MIFWLAKRLIDSGKKHPFLRFISKVSVTGVGVGVMSLIVVTSVINGFHGSLSRVVTSLNGDILIFSRTKPIDQNSEWYLRLKDDPEIESVTETLLGEVMISAEKGVKGTLLEGLNAGYQSVLQIHQNLTSGRWMNHDFEIVIGDSLKKITGAVLGGKISVIVPYGENGPTVNTFTVVGVVKFGMNQYDSKIAYTTLASIQKLFHIEKKISTFRLKVKKNVDSKEFSVKLMKRFTYPFKVKHWGEIHKNIFYAIELEKVVIALILTVILLVAGFNILSTLMMIVHEKKKTISVFKAIGLSQKKTLILFSLFGLGLALSGILIGAFSGWILSLLIDYFGLIKIPKEIYHLDQLPVQIRLKEYLLIILGSLGICWIASIIPAYKGSKIPPAQGVRHE